MERDHNYETQLAQRVRELERALTTALDHLEYIHRHEAEPRPHQTAWLAATRAMLESQRVTPK